MGSGLVKRPGLFGDDQLFRIRSGIGTKAINLSVALATVAFIYSR
jgi:hypothetical protein